MKFAYIASPDSNFTRTFLPQLYNLYGRDLLFICVLQRESYIQPQLAGVWLKLFIIIKNLKDKLLQWSSLLYWSVFCHQQGIAFITARDVNSIQIAELLANCHLALTAGIRKKFDKAIFTAPANGLINFHYSLLPKYRGTHPVFWQKVQGDSTFGYSFHLVNEKIDAGALVWQKYLTLDPQHAVADICNQLITHAAQQLPFLLQPLQKQAQDENQQSTYNHKEYSNYINLSIHDDGKDWLRKCRHTHRFILNKKWLIHMESTGMKNENSGYHSTGILSKNGCSFHIKKINYLPAVFYYFALRKYFE